MSTSYISSQHPKEDHSLESEKSHNCRCLMTWHAPLHVRNRVHGARHSVRPDLWFQGRLNMSPSLKIGNGQQLVYRYNKGWIHWSGKMMSKSCCATKIRGVWRKFSVDANSDGTRGKWPNCFPAEQVYRCNFNQQQCEPKRQHWLYNFGHISDNQQLIAYDATLHV